MVNRHERWLPVVGWEGLYEVSDQGRVRSLPRATKTGMRGGRILTPGRAADGRTVIGLCRDGRQVSRHISVLVAAAFIGPRPPGLMVCHGSRGNGYDGLANIRYDTQASNIQDAVRGGTHTNQNKAKTCCPKCGGDYRVNGKGVRYCPPCHLKTGQAWRAARKAERALLRQSS
jgi:hypothetical protein